MRTVLVILAAIALAVPAVAQSTIITPVTDGADIGDEPNVLAGGSYPHAIPGNPDGYPADANGIPEARLGAAPVRVLEMRPIVGGVVPQAHDISATWLLTPFLGQDYMTYQNTQYRVVVGDWSDSNGDGFIQNDRWERDDPYRTTDAQLRALHPVIEEELPQANLRGRDYAADSGDEWVGMENGDFVPGTQLVTYASGLVVPDGGFAVAPTSGRNPESLYRTDNNIDGYYTSLLFVDSPYGRNRYDEQFLNTVIYETFIGAPTPDAEGRAWTPSKFNPDDPNEQPLVDVDVYQAIDPAVEDIYTDTVDLAIAADLVLGGVNDDVEAVVDPIVEDATSGVPPLEPIVGPPNARLHPEDERGPDALGSNAHDYQEAWHPWVDQIANIGVAAPTPFLILSASLWEFSPAANGKAAVAPGELYSRIYHGLWLDKDGDGFIRDSDGTPDEPVEGCPDMNQCGAANGPGITAGGQQYNAAHSEWLGQCDPLGIDVTYTPVGGRWGATGVYVMGADEGDDDLDPTVQDLVTDGDADRLVTSGSITTTSSCNASNSPFQYFAAYKIVFPTGNPDYDIEVVTETKCTNMIVVGIPKTDCTRDIDILEAYAT